MPPINHGTTWPAEKHTLAKIEILRNNLNAFFPILGMNRPGENILFVDGFAGPGEYTNSPEGSPIAALHAADEAIKQNSQRWIAGRIHCAFIEPDSLRCANLRERVKNTPVGPMVSHEIYENNFVGGIQLLKQKHPRSFNGNEPLFVFIDPFGVTGSPFKTVASILASHTSEVLINLDSDGIARNFSAADRANMPQHELLLTDAFGDDSWRDAITGSDFRTKCQQVLELYKSKLRSLPRVEYVFSFEMRGKDDMLNYHLVFASQNQLGLEKMKEAMLAIDKSGSYSFSDGHVDQTTMFRFDHPKDFAPKLHKQFVGQEVAYPLIKKFTLNETPFLKPIQMLKVLFEAGQIRVTRFDPSKTGFSEDHVSKVMFLDVPPVVPKQKPKGLFDGY